MNTGNLDFIVKVAACVCGKDGLISQVEEMAIFSSVSSEFPNYTFVSFNKALDEFFDENLQIEDYLQHISDHALKSFTVQVCEHSASADGLDIKENIALHKVKLVLGAI